MPIYEYDCPKCGRFDAIQKFDEKPLKANPDCQDSKCPKKAQRVISPSAFHLKGGGWYKSDYAAKSKATKDSKEPSGADSTTSDKTANKGNDKAISEKKASDKDSGGGGKKGSCGSGCGCH